MSPTPCYFPPPKRSLVDRSLCYQIHQAAKESPPVFSLEVGPGTGRGWRMKAGQICRVSLISGSQVGDINMWSAANPKERMYTGKTRQIHASHLSVYDRIWSNLPHLRPLATITGDSIRYGIDSDGAGVHDVIGTRCDPHTIKLMTGATPTNTCHQNLTMAAEDLGLTEDDIHDLPMIRDSISVKPLLLAKETSLNGLLRLTCWLGLVPVLLGMCLLHVELLWMIFWGLLYSWKSLMLGYLSLKTGRR